MYKVVDLVPRPIARSPLRSASRALLHGRKVRVMVILERRLHTKPMTLCDYSLSWGTQSTQDHRQTLTYTRVMLPNVSDFFRFHTSITAGCTAHGESPHIAHDSAPPTSSARHWAGASPARPRSPMRAPTATARAPRVALRMTRGHAANCTRPASPYSPRRSRERVSG